MAISIGPKIGVDGEPEYRKAMQNIVAQAKTLESEMKLVASSFSNATTAEEKAKASKEVLTKQIKTQKDALAEQNTMLDKAKAKYGENATETLKMQTIVNKTTTELNRLQSELDSTANSVDDVSDSMGTAQASTSTFGDVLKANLLSQAIVAGVKQLADAMKDFAISTLETAATVKAEVSQFSQTFGDFADESTQAIGRVADDCGIIDTRLNATGTQLYAFARAAGGDATQSLDLMERSLQAAADAAAYYDKDLSNASESLMSFLKGNFANDAALGVSCTETTRNAAAMELFGQKYNDLSEIQKQETLLQMVVDAQKASGAFGQAAREADGWENVQGNLSETWRQFQANVGAPLLEAIIPIVQQITESFKEWQASVDWDAFGQAVQNFVSLITENGASIVTTIAAIATAFVGWNVGSMIAGIATQITALGGILPALKAGIAGINAVLAANPVGIVVVAITALITGIVLLWQNCEWFREGVTAIFTAVVEAVSSFGYMIIDFFTVTIPNAIQAVVGFFQNNWQALLLLIVNPFAGAFLLLYNNFEGFRLAVDTLVENVKTFFVNLGTSIITSVGNIKTSVVDGFNAAINFIKELPAKALEWGKDFIMGFVNGINDSISAVVGAVSNVASTITSWLHFSRPDIGPLHNYEEWMPDFMMGLSKGIRANVWMVEDAIKALTLKMGVNLSASQTGGTIVQQSIHFGYEVQAPDEVARSVRQQTTYGLAGAR